MLISVYTSILGHSNEIWPSLLHFAAEFNLPKFCEELLKLPYSMDETFIMNKDSEIDQKQEQMQQSLATSMGLVSSWQSEAVSSHQHEVDL
jgi:hypothetical protein